MEIHGMREDCEFDEYVNKIFLPGKSLYGPYWEHLNNAWTHRNNPNFKIVWYEDLVSDMPKMIKEIATFTGYTLSEEQVEKLANHCTVDNFKKNSAVNFRPGFIRKGQVGDWKNHFKNPETLEKFNEWIAMNNTENIPIKYEL